MHPASRWPTHRTKEEFRISDPRTNDRIRVPEVRLVGPAGEQVGVVRIEVALRLAQEADLDLVEVAPNSKPPVVKIMDYGKFKYEAAQKAKEARRNQANTILKEVRFRLKIDEHDYETKRKRAEGFLQGRRQGQGHDPVPRSRAVAPRAGRAPAAASSRRTSPSSAPSSRTRRSTVATWSW